MRKSLYILLILFVFVALANAQEEKDNPGYQVSHGMAGIFMGFPNYSPKGFNNSSIGGGGFAYYNIVNKFWGNIAIGLGSEYQGTDYKKNDFELAYNASMMLIPTALNIAYMTSSDTVNAWGGFALTYNYIEMKVKNGTTYNNAAYESFGKQKTTIGQVVGADLFAGLEYIFDSKGMFGAFFEFRYSFMDNFALDVPINSISGAAIKTNFNLSRFRYTIGLSLHF